MKSIIVNLSKNDGSIKQIVDQVTKLKQDWSLIDFSGSKFEFENITCFSARKLDPNNKIERHSIRALVNTVGDLSLKKIKGSNIRQLRINGLPIYWLTNFAEKHPFKHWMFAFFFLRGFLGEKPDFFDGYEKIIIIAPVSEEVFNAYVEQQWPWLRKKIKVMPSVHVLRFPLLKTFYHAFRFYLKYLLSYLSNGSSAKMSKNLYPPDLILIYETDPSLKSTLKKHISAFLENKGNLLEVHLQGTIFNPASSNSAFLAKNYPQPFEVFSMLLQIWKCSKKICRSYHSADSKNDFWNNVLTVELYNSLQLIPLYFLHLWLSKIFLSVNKSLKIFYEDEMYKIGRIISSAAIVSNNNYIKTIAYQHGNISENHSVYRFCDAEITELEPGNKDAVPLPDIFLVWGEYFKRQFLEWFSANPERVVVAGNLVYLDLKKKYSHNRIRSKSIKNILWCTTSFDFAKSEYEIMRRKLETNNFSVSLRMHPNYHIKDQLRKIIPDSLYSCITWDDTMDIYETINHSDLVVCSGHSTVFIDCLILKKPVIRLFNLSVMNDYLTGANIYVKNALSQDEFAEALAFFRSESNTPDTSEYLYLESDKIWQKIVTAP